MPTAEAKEQIAAIKKSIESLSSERTDALVRRDELGAQLCFEELVEEFFDILDIVRDLESIALDRFPQPILGKISGPLNSVLSVIKRIKTFNASTQAGAQSRTEIVTQVVSAHRELLEATALILPLGLLRNLKTSETLADLRTEVQKVQEARVKVEENLKSAESALQKIRDVSGVTGVAAHAIEFEKQAGQHRKSALGWMGVTVAVGIGSAVLAYFLFHGVLAGDDTAWTGGHAVRSIAFRVVLLSFCTYFITWSARNYRANRHNEIVNTHRRIALSTFETFAKAAEADKDTKNAVLLQATQAIFSAQRSGYLDKEPDASPQSTIVEILRRSQGDK